MTTPQDLNSIGGLVEAALAEDLGDGDVTAAAVVPEGARSRARFLQKQSGVLFGFECAAEAFRQCGVHGFEPLVDEGAWQETPLALEVATIEGPARALLAAERVALNFLGRLSGIATLTARFVEAVAGTGTSILDTRKTTPGLRVLEKAAVVAGGGVNHRFGLYDAILIKENHAALAGGVGIAVELALAARPDLPVEVECRSVEEVGLALAAGANRVLLDNMSIAELEASAAIRGRHLDAGDRGSGAPDDRPELEASGGVTLENVAEIAATGVDFISIGALTHSAPTLDLSMLLFDDADSLIG